jgi:histidine ammonia-lyase
MSIQFLSLVQAVDSLEMKENLSSKTFDIYNKIREIVPNFTDDKIKYKELEAITNFLKTN